MAQMIATIEVHVTISLWDALKLRLSGPAGKEFVKAHIREKLPAEPEDTRESDEERDT